MGKKFLVVVDMQNDFVDGALGTKEAELIVSKVAEKINGFAGEICYTLDTHYDNYMDTQEGKNLPVKHCIKGTEGHDLCPAVAQAIQGKIDSGCHIKGFLKETFGSTDLVEYLAEYNKNEGIEEITFVGLCTGICVISNAMMTKAFMPELPIKIDASCCACVTPESHKTALEAMKLCQMEIEQA